MAVLSTDTFTRVDNPTSLGSTDGNGQLDPLAWTTLQGFCGVLAGRAYASSLNAGLAAAVCELSRADVDISVTQSTRGNQSGIMFRVVDGGQYWGLVSGTGAAGTVLFRFGPSLALQVLGSWTGTADGDILRVVASGDSITAYRNGALLGSFTNSYLNTATKHGIYINDVDTRFDSWSARDPGSETSIFPHLNVLIGFLAASNASNTGPYLTFDDTTYGKFNTGTFAADYIWTDVTADVRSLSVTRGRQRQIEAFAAGTATLVLDDNLGNYDSDNPAGLYYGNVLPMRPIQITAAWDGISYPIFYGYIDAFSPDYSPGRYSDAWVTVTASDAMKVLQNIPSSGAAPAELTGARINRILDNAGWPAALRTIAAGDCLLQATTLSSTVASDIQSSVDSEYGRWYIDASGKVVFENRSSRSAHQVPIATWSDTDTNGRLYSDLGRTIDDDLIRNRVSIQNIGGVAQVLTDATSITQYQSRSYSASNLLLTADSEAYQLANIILYNGKQLAGCRFDSVGFEPVTNIPAGNPGDLWPEVLGRQISDRVAVTVTPPYISPMTMGAFVEGVSHNIGTSPNSWTTSFHASRSAPTTFIQFDDATFGRLGSGNTIGQ